MSLLRVISSYLVRITRGSDSKSPETAEIMISPGSSPAITSAVAIPASESRVTITDDGCIPRNIKLVPCRNTHGPPGYFRP